MSQYEIVKEGTPGLQYQIVPRSEADSEPDPVTEARPTFGERVGRRGMAAAEAATSGLEALKESFTAEPAPTALGGILRGGERALRMIGGLYSPVQFLSSPIGAAGELAASPFMSEENAQMVGHFMEAAVPLGAAKLAQMGKLVLPANLAGATARAALGIPAEEIAPSLAATRVRPLTEPTPGDIKYRYRMGQEPSVGEQIPLRLKEEALGRPFKPGAAVGPPPLENFPGERIAQPSPLAYELMQELIEKPVAGEQFPLFTPGIIHRTKLKAFTAAAGRGARPQELAQFKNLGMDEITTWGENLKEVDRLKKILVENPDAALPPTRALALATEMVQAAKQAEALGAKSTARQIREDASRLIDQEGGRWLAAGRPGSSTLAGSVAGSYSGYETDDEGNVWFDPGKALLGATAGAVGMTMVNRAQQSAAAAKKFAELVGRSEAWVKDAYRGSKIPTDVVKDLTSKIERKFIIPHTLAENDAMFAPHYRNGLRFFENRSMIENLYSEKLGDVLKGIPKKLHETLVIGDSMGREFTPPQLKGMGHTPDDIRQYGQIRDALNFGLDTLESHLVRSGTDAAEAAKSIGELRRRGYFPGTRFGKYHTAIEDAQGNLTFFASQEGKLEHNRAKSVYQSLIPTGGKLRAYLSPDIPPSMMKSLDVTTLAALSQVDEEVRAMLGQTAGPLSLTNLLARANLTGGGFPKHFIRKQAIPGVSEDAAKVLADYGRGLGQYIARREARAAAAPLLEDLRKANKLQLMDYARSYIDDVVNPTGDMGGLREGLFHYYLAAKISSAVVNLSGHLTLGYPVLGRYTKNAASQWGRGIKEAFLNDAKLNPEVAQGLRLAKLEGVVGDPTTQELLGTASGRSPTLRGASDLAGAMFGRAETSIRKASYISAHNIAREEMGLKGEAAHEFAKKVTREINLDYSKADRPEIIRAGAAAPFGTFRLFQYNVLSKFKDAIKRGEYGTLARHVGTLGAVAGLIGMPGAKSLVDAAREYGYDVPTWVREKFGRGGEVALRGLPYAAGALWGEPDKGIDLAGSAGLGDVVPSELFTDPWEGVSKLIGGVLADPVVRGTRFVKLLSMGETGRALEAMMPEALRSGSVAVRGVREGAFTTPYGEPLYVPSSFDIGMKAMGFQPTGLSRAYEREAAERALRYRASGSSEQFYREIAKAIATRDEAGIHKAVTRVQQFNQNAEPWERVNLGTDQARSAIRRHVMNFTVPEQTERRALPKKARARYQVIQEVHR